MKKTFEIECKAWVEDPDALRVELNNRYEYKTSYIKDDTYYHFPGRAETFRIRRQEGQSIVTVKKKSRENGIEENLETEFTVSDGDAFVSFIGEIGCPVYISKRKNTEVFTTAGITIELSFVDTLGWFIEIEKLVTSDSIEDKKKAKKALITILTELKIQKEKLEERYYTEMLTGKME